MEIHLAQKMCVRHLLAKGVEIPIDKGLVENFVAEAIQSGLQPSRPSRGTKCHSLRTKHQLSSMVGRFQEAVEKTIRQVTRVVSLWDKFSDNKNLRSQFSMAILVLPLVNCVDVWSGGLCIVAEAIWRSIVSPKGIISLLWNKEISQWGKTKKGMEIQRLWIGRLKGVANCVGHVDTGEYKKWFSRSYEDIQDTLVTMIVVCSRAKALLEGSGEEFQFLPEEDNTPNRRRPPTGDTRMTFGNWYSDWARTIQTFASLNRETLRCQSSLAVSAMRETLRVSQTTPSLESLGAILDEFECRIDDEEGTDSDLEWAEKHARDDQDVEEDEHEVDDEEDDEDEKEDDEDIPGFEGDEEESDKEDSPEKESDSEEEDEYQKETMQVNDKEDSPEEESDGEEDPKEESNKEDSLQEEDGDDEEEDEYQKETIQENDHSSIQVEESIPTEAEAFSLLDAFCDEMEQDENLAPQEEEEAVPDDRAEDKAPREKETKSYPNSAELNFPKQQRVCSKMVKDAISGEFVNTTVTGDIRQKTFPQIKAGEYSITCPCCDAARVIGPKTKGFDSIVVMAPEPGQEEGRRIIDDSIEQLAVRRTTNFRKFRTEHLAHCVYVNRIKGKPEEERKHKRDAFYIEKYYPVMYKQVKIKYDQTLTKTIGGKVDYAYYKDEREKRRREEMRLEVEKEVKERLAREKRKADFFDDDVERKVQRKLAIWRKKFKADNDARLKLELEREKRLLHEQNHKILSEEKAKLRIEIEKQIRAEMLVSNDSVALDFRRGIDP